MMNEWRKKMKNSRKKRKQRIELFRKLGLDFDVVMHKYYFTKIKKNKEEYILFLILYYTKEKYEEDIYEHIVDKYAYFNYETGKLEEITLYDVTQVRIKYLHS